MRHWLHMRRWLNDAGGHYILRSCGWLRLYGAEVHKEAATLAELKVEKQND